MITAKTPRSQLRPALAGIINYDPRVRSNWSIIYNHNNYDGKTFIVQAAGSVKQYCNKVSLLFLLYGSKQYLYDCDYSSILRNIWAMMSYSIDIYFLAKSIECKKFFG